MHTSDAKKGSQHPSSHTLMIRSEQQSSSQRRKGQTETDWHGTATTTPITSMRL